MEGKMRDPVRENLARAESKLATIERWGEERGRAGWQRHLAHGVARSCRALVRRREEALVFEEEQRLKLLRGDPSSRCMFLKGR
jgi:hypothetical protein